MKILAFDCSTETLSIALSVDAAGAGAQILEHTEQGGAKTSAIILPSIIKQMSEAGLAFADLDAIAFGRGPGAFTGLRTACAVAQGLAFAHNIPVLPVDTLLALAEEARHQTQQNQIYAVLDARMGEAYVAAYDFTQNPKPWQTSAQLLKLEDVLVPKAYLMAGNIAPQNLGQLDIPEVSEYFACLPTARAMLRLAPSLLKAGCAVAAEEALPIYIRVKVAQTTVERLAAAAENA